MLGYKLSFAVFSANVRRQPKWPLSGRRLPERFRSAKGGDARRHTEKELREAPGGELDTPTVLREFRKSAKGGDARRHTEKELRELLGGELDTATVLRELRKS